MFQANTTLASSINGATSINFWLLIATIIAVAWAIIEELLRRHEGRRRYISEKVYEPILDEVSAIFREILINGLPFDPHVWEEGRNASIGTLLQRDYSWFDRLLRRNGRVLFNELDEFYIILNYFLEGTRSSPDVLYGSSQIFRDFISVVDDSDYFENLPDHRKSRIYSQARELLKTDWPNRKTRGPLRNLNNSSLEEEFHFTKGRLLEEHIKPRVKRLLEKLQKKLKV